MDEEIENEEVVQIATFVVDAIPEAIPNLLNKLKGSFLFI